jgi:hypothetical protein|tara:strand:- start:5455 stop:5901 length:447 start_codon:yes stop_codon:yes gene_type:complete
MNIEDLLEMWGDDSKIDEQNLDDTTIRGASLHSKYLELHSVAKLRLKKKEQDLSILKKDKWLWFNGKMEKEDMDKHGWPYDPFNGMNKPLKTDLQQFYDSDKDIMEASMQIEYQKTYVEVCKEILDNIKWRHTQIKNIIDWRRFQSGA